MFKQETVGSNPCFFFDRGSGPIKTILVNRLAERGHQSHEGMNPLVLAKLIVGGRQTTKVLDTKYMIVQATGR